MIELLVYFTAVKWIYIFQIRNIIEYGLINISFHKFNKVMM